MLVSSMQQLTNALNQRAPVIVVDKSLHFRLPGRLPLGALVAMTDYHVRKGVSGEMFVVSRERRQR